MNRTEELLEAAVEIAAKQTESGLEPTSAQAVLGRVRAQVKKPRRWPLLVAAASMALIVALILARRPARLPSYPEAMAVIYRSGEVSIPMRTLELSSGVALSLGRGAQLDLTMDDAGRLALRDGAKVLWRASAQLELQAGRAILEMSGALSAGDAQLVAENARFQVRVDEGRLVSLYVERGQVRVSRKAQRELVQAQQHWGEAPKKSLASLRSLRSPWWSKREVPAGYLWVESEPSGADVLLDGAFVGTSPLLVRWEAGALPVQLKAQARLPYSAPAKIAVGEVTKIAAKLELLPERKAASQPEALEAPQTPTRVEPAASDDWRLARKLLARRRCAKLERLSAKLARRASSSATAARAWMLSAECRLRTSNKQRALARFEEIVQKYPRTPSAEAALFEQAKLLDDLGRRSLETFERYLKKHPQGRFVEEATMRRCEGLIRTQRTSEAKACLQRYRARFPRALRARQAVLLLATLARVEGQYLLAAGLYAEYLQGAPGAPKAEEARYQRAKCLRFARAPEAVSAASAYLKAHPKGARADEVRGWLR